MMDRSMSALRTLRPESDQGIFWFRDDLHQPYPISPMGMTTLQKHHAWGYQVAAAQTQLPPSKGAYVKVHQGRVYLGFALIDDPREVAQRAQSFGKLLEHCKEHWEDYYNGYIAEVVTNLNAMAAVDGDRLALPALLEHLRNSERLNRRAWEIHFILMYPADAIYLEFEAFCQRHGLQEKDFVGMLKGFDSMPARTDEGLWKLAKLAEELGLRALLLDTGTEALTAALEALPKGRAWLKQLGAFMAVHGNRISAAHLDVLFSTWKEDPAPVLDTIRSYFRRMDEGWDFHGARKAVLEQSQRAAQAFEKTLPEPDRASFRKILKNARQIYAYQEDHGFYIDQGATAALHTTLMSCGRRLQGVGLLAEAADVFFLTFSELVEILEDLARDETIATYHHLALVPSLVKERKADWASARNQDAPLTIGNVPTTMTDPIAIKVFGIVDNVLHPKGEKVVEERLSGFPGSPGKVEGKARVIRNFEEFPFLQAGEILVCPYTSTAWTPLFLKIAGVITDTGGMLTHAAIAAREYGIPAVVGTWNATNSIRNGDLVRLNGDDGIVEIVRRAS